MTMKKEEKDYKMTFDIVLTKDFIMEFITAYIIAIFGDEV